MGTSGLRKYAGALAVLAICSACGGGLRPAQGDMAVAPSSVALNGKYVGRTLWVNGRPITAARLNPNPPSHHAAIVPDRRRSRKRFEYIISFYGSYASIFDYPKSDAQIGTINDVGGQGCTNALYGYGKKIFWIVASNQITEYKVAQKPIKTLSVSYSLGQPSSCAMDTSGDLAVGILIGSGGGDIVIFKNAAGTGTVYTTPLSEEYFDGYDSKGNLFADGYSKTSGAVTLVELPKGSSKFQTIATSNTVLFPGSVQWDGTYLTVFDQNASEFYQYTISGTKATLKNTISLTGVGDCAQTWIVKGLVYCGDYYNNDGEVFKYPAGGSALAVLTGSFNSPLGVTVSRR